ncbi:MAG: hypothetical protein N2111_07360 [Candidatus Sumerlaeaceae bacterium]|nr:hypothetical protein [Candidatus Sumerlaeaceae bacterium]
MQNWRKSLCGGRRVSRRGWLTAVVAGALGAAAAALAGTAAAAAGQPKLECPANWQKGTRACKRARADRKCPELRGGKCLADDAGQTTATTPTSAPPEAPAPPSS